MAKKFRGRPPSPPPTKRVFDISQLTSLPVTNQQINDLISKYREFDLFSLKKKAMEEIERIRSRPLICYAAKTYGPLQNLLKMGVTPSIDNSDVDGFADLVRTTPGNKVDVMIISNGGSAESVARIVHLLRGKFDEITFIIPGNAYSAATLMCLCGDEIIMDDIGTLGPIDPQMGGIPARAILRGVETIEERLKKEGPSALSAYLPLLAKYDLHILEMCKSAQELSKNLATKWLSKHMFKLPETDPLVVGIVDNLTSYDTHLSHGMTISRDEAASVGLKVTRLEDIKGLEVPVRSLYNQYMFFFDKTGFYKAYECARGVNWGKQITAIQMNQKP